MRKIISLTESELHELIKDSVKKSKKSGSEKMQPLSAAFLFVEKVFIE